MSVWPLLPLWLSACAAGPGHAPKAGGTGGAGGTGTPDSGATTETGGPDTGPHEDSGADRDLDGDGYFGGAGGEDCDDSDADIHPHAAEACGDGLDSDCDGQGGACTLGASALRLSGPRDGDDAGFSVAVAGDINGDGAWDLVTGGATADVEARDGGGVWIMAGPFTASGSLSSAMAIVGGAIADDAAGYAVAGPGDIDGDGYSDIAVGAPYAADGTGEVSIHLGPLLGSSSTADADGRWQGEASGDRAGIALASVADTDGDGHPDLLLGANTSDLGATDGGACYLISSAALASGGGLGLATARLVGEASADKAGRVSGAGDVDGDGLHDLLAGSPGSDEAASDAGLAALFLAPVTGDVSLADADARLLGELEGDRAGVGVAGLGDADGDGRSDLAVGANNADGMGVDAGSVYLIYEVSLGTTALADAPTRLLGEADGDTAGWPLSAPGDLDGDGLADLLVGANGQDTGGNAAGAVYAVPGTHGGTSSLGDAMSRWYGATTNGLLGFSVAGSASTASPHPVLIGAPAEDSGAGSVYVLPGAF